MSGCRSYGQHYKLDPRQSAINIAEGRKQSVILASEAVQAERRNTAAEAEAIPAFVVVARLDIRRNLLHME